MHHIKGVKYLKGTTVHSVMMKSLNRTQVSLCRAHHQMAHKNGLMKLIKDNNPLLHLFFFVFILTSPVASAGLGLL
jgi:hypothetical protein